METGNWSLSYHLPPIFPVADESRKRKRQVECVFCTHTRLYVHAHAAELIGSGRQENERQHLFPSIHLLVMMVIKLELERTSSPPLTLSPGLCHAHTNTQQSSACSVY